MIKKGDIVAVRGSVNPRRHGQLGIVLHVTRDHTKTVDTQWAEVSLLSGKNFDSLHTMQFVRLNATALIPITDPRK